MTEEKNEISLSNLGVALSECFLIDMYMRKIWGWLGEAPPPPEELRPAERALVLQATEISAMVGGLRGAMGDLYKKVGDLEFRENKRRHLKGDKR